MMPFEAKNPRKNPPQPYGGYHLNQEAMVQASRVSSLMQFPNAYPVMNQMNIGLPQQSGYSPMPSLINKKNPTLVPKGHFNAATDADVLKKAMKGIGTDKNALINVLCHRSCGQRMEIKNAFDQIYSRQLIDDIKSETSGNFQKVLIGLLTPNVDFYCAELLTSKKDDVIIDVICMMEKEEISQISEAFQRMNEKSLTQHIREFMSGSLANLCANLAENMNESSVVNKLSAVMDAKILRDSINKFFKDESNVVQIFSKGFEHMKMVSQEYQNLGNKQLEKEIESKFSGSFKQALLAILNFENQTTYFARRLYKSMVGLGTDDKTLIYLCITRCEIDMMDIKIKFQDLYKESLKSFIKGDNSGHYMNALLALIGEK